MVTGVHCASQISKYPTGPVYIVQPLNVVCLIDTVWMMG